MQEKPSVLIVDDSPIVLRLLNNILKDDCKLIFAKTGELGLEYAKKHAPDIILLDIMMPGLTGFDVLTALKADEDTAAIPVIFITGSELSENVDNAYILGAMDYIIKPFIADDVKRRVKFNLDLLDKK